MTTASCVVPTTNGDGTNPVDLWSGATPAQLRITPQFKHAVVPTTSGDGINPIELWAGATPAQLRVAFQQRQQVMAYGAYDPIRGYVFVIDPATLQPDLPRNTRFPQAQ
jgi:hypothetical protein